MINNVLLPIVLFLFHGIAEKMDDVYCFPFVLLSLGIGLNAAIIQMEFELFLAHELTSSDASNFKLHLETTI